MTSMRFVFYFIGLLFVLPCSCKEDLGILDISVAEDLSKVFPRPFAPNCDISFFPKRLNDKITSEFFETYLKWHDDIYKFADFRNILDRYHHLIELSRQFDDNVMRWIDVRLSIDLSFYNLKEKSLSLGEILGQKARLNSELLDHISRIDALTGLGYVQYQNLQHEKSLKSVEAALGLLHNPSLYDRKKELLFLRIMNFNNTGLLDAAIEILDDLDSLCREDINCLAFSAHLRGINYYFREDEEEAEKQLSHSIGLHNEDKCTNIYNKSRTYYELANSCHRKNEFQLAQLYYDSAIWFYNKLYINPKNERKNIYNITLNSGKAELLTDMAIRSGSVRLGERAFWLFKKIEKLLRETEKFDRDSHIQNQYFHNFYYSYVIKLCAFLEKKTQNEKWTRYMLEQLANYKSSSLSRDLKLNHLWKIHSEDVNSLVYKFVMNDKRLESLLNSDAQLGSNLEELTTRTKLIENREKYFRLLYLDGLLGDQGGIRDSSGEIDELIQSSKWDNVARVFYYVGGALYNDDLMYVIVIYKGTIKSYSVNDCADIMTKVDTVFSWHKNQHTTQLVSPVVYSKLSNEIYKAILLPVISDLDGLEGVHVVPDNSLHTLPFGSLVTSSGSYISDYSQMCYLINEIDVSYGYLVNDQPCGTNKIDGMVEGLAMSNSDRMAAFAWSSKQAIIDQPSNEFQELPGSILEIDGLRDVVNKSYAYVDYKGYHASKNSFLLEAPRCSIIHLALHATTGLSNRLDSKLYFRSNQSIEELFDFDLQYLKLNAELVTLSGCYTNAGKNQESEGLFSMSRAFYKAGAKRVISNTWALDDRFASSFFTEFYKHLFDRHDYVPSISMTKRAYLNSCLGDECFPGVWAGLVIHK